ncbi:hypothetical protein BH11PLA2_BH11PLA2_14260 [soil metagenome]
MEHAQEWTDALTSAVAVALREMAGVQSALVGSTPVDGVPSAGEVSVVIRTFGAGPGSLRLSMPNTTASALAHRILAETVPNPDEALIRDCIGEVANIIAGQAKTLLYGTLLHFSFSSPVQDDFEPPPQAEGLQLTFGSDVGALSLTVYSTTSTLPNQTRK